MTAAAASPASRTLIRIGTRRSALAMAQSRHVANCLEQLPSAPKVELITISTKGDLDQSSPLPEIGGKGLFTEELEQALLTSKIDLAVHSLKDLPTELPEGLELVAVPKREDPRDVLITHGEARDLSELAPGSRVGTSSLRRAAQILAIRQDLQVVPLRGNVDTRLRKVRDGQVDAAVIAHAGLRRLGLTDRITCILEVNQMLPAPGQGCLGIEARLGDDKLGLLLAELECEQTRRAATAERTLLAKLGGGCRVPVAALAVPLTGMTLELSALVATPNGSRILEAQKQGDDPFDLGGKVAEDLLGRGAAEVLDA